MKPYVVVVEQNEQIHVEEFDNLVIAWDWCTTMNKIGRRAFAAAVLAAPEVMLELDRIGPLKGSDPLLTFAQDAARRTEDEE